MEGGAESRGIYFRKRTGKKKSTISVGREEQTKVLKVRGQREETVERGRGEEVGAQDEMAFQTELFSEMRGNELRKGDTG